MESEESPDVIEDMSAHLTAIVVSEQADTDEGRCTVNDDDIFLPILCVLFVEYYTQVRRRTAAPMFVSCSTADRSRWCAELAHSQCHHDIEEWVSPLQVYRYIYITRVGSFTSPGIDTR